MDSLIALFDPKVHQYLVIAATIVALASASGKMLEGACFALQGIIGYLESVVAAISVRWPEAAKANVVLIGWCTTLSTIAKMLGALMATCAKLQASSLLQGLALNPAQGAPSHPQVAVLPSGVGLNLPSKSSGFVAIRTLLALSVLALGVALARPALAQTTTVTIAGECATGQVMDPYQNRCVPVFKEGQFSQGPMLSGFLFRLQDPATGKPADYSFGAGLGYNISWDFVPEDFGATIGFQKPLVSLGFGALAVGTEDANQLLLSVGAGPEICFVDHLACIVFVPDLAQVFGSDVTGLLVGKVGAANVATALTVGFQFGGSGQLSTR